jgi:hypothetical protein
MSWTCSSHARHETHPGPVKEPDHQSHRTAQMRQDRFDLLARQHDGQARRPLRRLDPFEPGERLPEDLLVEKQHCAFGLVLRRGRHRLRRCEMGQKRLDLRRPHLGGLSLVMMRHEAPDPVHVRLLGPDAVMLAPDPVPDLVQQTGVVRHPYGPPKVCLLLDFKGYYNSLKCLILGSRPLVY